MGGAGADVFAYEQLRDSRGGDLDRILDLAAEDVIDLAAIDADVTAGGDHAFVLVGDLTGQAGQAALVLTGDVTELRLDVDGDGEADAVILLDGDHTGHTRFVL
jgi:serralysin